MSKIARVLAVLVSSSFLLAGAAFGQKAEISAELKGSNGRGAANAEVRLERQDKKMAPMTFRADRNGKWSSNSLDAGVYKVTAIVPGEKPSSQIVRTKANHPTIVAFNMKGAATEKKTYRWVQTTTGTHMGGHYEEVNGEPQHVGPYTSAVEGMSPETLSRINQGTNGRAGAGGL